MVKLTLVELLRDGSALFILNRHHRAMWQSTWKKLTQRTTKKIQLRVYINTTYNVDFKLTIR